MISFYSTIVLASILVISDASANQAKRPYTTFEFGRKTSALVHSEGLCSDLLKAHALAVNDSRRRGAISAATLVFADMALTKDNKSGLLVQLMKNHQTNAALPQGVRRPWMSQMETLVRRDGRSLLPPIAARHAKGALVSDAGLVIGYKFTRSGFKRYIRENGAAEFAAQQSYALDLSGAAGFDAKQLGQFRGLTHLDVTETGLGIVFDENENSRGWDEFNAIGKLTQLTHLWIGNNNLSVGLGTLLKLTRLVVLDVHRGGLNPYALAAIADAFPELEQLDLSDNALGFVRWEGDVPKVKDLKALRKLSQLDIARAQIDDAGASQLALLPSLRQLNISGNQISDAGAAAIATLRLDTLNIDMNWLMSMGRDLLDLGSLVDSSNY